MNDLCILKIFHVFPSNVILRSFRVLGLEVPQVSNRLETIFEIGLLGGNNIGPFFFFFFFFRLVRKFLKIITRTDL